MNLIIDRLGVVHCLYGESIDLGVLGESQIRRVSLVEADAQGSWWADMAPVDGPRLGPFSRRGQALDAERAWLDHWLLANAEFLNPFAD